MIYNGKEDRNSEVSMFYEIREIQFNYLQYFTFLK